MSTAVAKAKETAVSTDVLDDIFETAGEGAAFDSSEMQIPFVRVLQALSPQLNKKKAEYIEGAAQGDLFNTVTGQWWSGEQGVTVVPCYHTIKYLEFVPRDMGGGFKGEIHPSNPVLQQTTRSGSKEMLPSGNELVKSAQYFCFVVEEDGSYQPAVIDMKSTQLKVAKRWNTQIQLQKVRNPKTGGLVTPALFATMWKLTTTEESNDQGSWNNYQVEKVGLVESRDLLLEAKAFRESIAAGEVKAAPEAPSDNGGGFQTTVTTKSRSEQPRAPLPPPHRGAPFLSLGVNNVRRSKNAGCLRGFEGCPRHDESRKDRADREGRGGQPYCTRAADRG
jgi:hypothetical protein